MKALFTFVILCLSFSISWAANLTKVDFSKSKRVAVYFGTFDPPHLGHSALAHWALNTLGVDHLIVMPLQNPLHKSTANAYPTRLAMTQLQFEQDAKIGVPDIFDRRSARSILSGIRKQNPGIEFIGMIGGDYLNSEIRWNLNLLYHRMIGVSKFAVILRSPEDAALAADLKSKNVEVYRMSKFQPESSTKVRAGHIEMVGNKVRNFILDRNLYDMNSKVQLCEKVF